MRKVALIYNPRSGRNRARREREVARAAEVLRGGGIEVLTAPTHAAGSATQQAAEAIAAGCDAVFACGGDGTMNEVLQAVMGTDAALGVLPLGTANQLAFDLGIPSRSEAAVQALMGGERRQVLPGTIEFERPGGGRGSRYFLVTAGIGPDAALMYRVAGEMKRRLGMYAYYLESVRLFLAYHYAPFSVEFEVEREARREVASGLLAVRIAAFRGLIGELAPGAGLERGDLRLVLFKTSKRISYLRYAAGVLARRQWTAGDVELLSAVEVRAHGGRQRLHAEVDGECVGTLPARIGMAQQKCTLLVPRGTAAVALRRG